MYESENNSNTECGIKENVAGEITAGLTLSQLKPSFAFHFIGTIFCDVSVRVRWHRGDTSEQGIYVSAVLL